MIADAISRAETLNNKEVIDYLIRDIKYGSCFLIFTKHIKVQSIFDPMALSRLSPCYLKCICSQITDFLGVLKMIHIYKSWHINQY